MSIYIDDYAGTPGTIINKEQNSVNSENQKPVLVFMPVHEFQI